MLVTVTEASDINEALQRFSMTAALDNMSRFGSQLCMAPSNAGLLDYAQSELAALVCAAKQNLETHCSDDAVTALRQSLKGVTMSMDAGSTGGREIDDMLRAAAHRFEADGIDEPIITVFPIHWRRTEPGLAKPHEAIITQSQLDAVPDGGRGGERKRVKTILETRYRSTIHQMKYRRLVEGFIPGPIHESVARHERYFAGVMGRPVPETPTDENLILEGMRRTAQSRLMRMASPHGGRGPRENRT